MLVSLFIKLRAKLYAEEQFLFLVQWPTSTWARISSASKRNPLQRLAPWRGAAASQQRPADVASWMVAPDLINKATDQTFFLIIFFILYISWTNTKSEEPQRQFLSTQVSTHTCFVCTSEIRTFALSSLGPIFSRCAVRNLQVLIEAFLSSYHKKVTVMPSFEKIHIFLVVNHWANFLLDFLSA